jgi:NAD(P)-dependent dehydrogenase (short-subunit alcohol dehydrogenase family)
MGEQRKAIVVGVGPQLGLGAALCRRFAGEGLHVFVAGRTGEKIDAVAAAIAAEGGTASAIVADATKEDDIVGLFDRAESEGAGTLDLVVYNAGNMMAGELREMEAGFFEHAWRVGCFGGFLVGREAARRLVPQGRGTVIFTGATASLKGRSPFGAFASAKAALRSLAQTMARAYGPHGIHVAHVVIDGAIAGERQLSRRPELAEKQAQDRLLDIDAIADSYWHLHTQHRSAWTHELDLRPYSETF